MTPQERPEPGRTRREGYIQTEFATRVRSAVISLAKREAREAVKRKLRAEGHTLADPFRNQQAGKRLPQGPHR